MAVVFVAWLLLFFLNSATAAAVHLGQSSRSVSVSNMPGMNMPGMEMPPQSGHGVRVETFFAGLPIWVLMTVAMMGLVALPAVRYTALNTLVWRRRRAMIEFLFGYILVWSVFGALLLGAVMVAPPLVSHVGVLVALAVATLWQLSDSHRTCLRACHRGRRLPPSGWSAELGAGRFGVMHGIPCIGSCWPLMTVAALAPAEPLLFMMIVTPPMIIERFTRRPFRASRWIGGALALVTAGYGLDLLI